MGGSRSKAGLDQTHRHQRLVSAVAGLDLATASSHYLAAALFLCIPAFLTLHFALLHCLPILQIQLIPPPTSQMRWSGPGPAHPFPSNLRPASFSLPSFDLHTS